MKCVIYAAKSTEDKHGSIGTQLADARAMAEREGWEIVGEHQDEAFSAYHGNRGPGLEQAKQAAVAAAAEHGQCILVAQDADRFARGAGDAPGAADHLGEIFFAMKRQGVELWTVRSRQLDSLRAVLEGERATDESARKSQAVKAGVKRRVADRRQYIGGRRPFGYEWVNQYDNGLPRTTRDGRIVKCLEPVPAEATVVRRIFAEYVVGRAQNAIARDLRQHGVPTLTPTGEWYATTVAGMLKNPLYIGEVTHDGEHYPAEHKPLIDRATWDKACVLRQSRGSCGRPRGRRTAGRHVLTEGLLSCPTCGAAMSTVTQRDERRAEGNVYETYACVKRLHHGPTACAQKRIKRADIDGAVWRLFEKDVLDLDATRELVVKQVEQQLGDEDDLRQQAESEAAKAEARLAKVERDYLDCDLPAAEWQRLKAKLTAELDGAHAQAEQHCRQREAMQAVVADFDAKAVIARELTALRERVIGEVRDGSGDLERFRALLQCLFVSFELVPNDDGSYLLLPWMRVSRVGGRWDFEAAGRAPLDVNDFLQTPLAA